MVSTLVGFKSNPYGTSKNGREIHIKYITTECSGNQTKPCGMLKNMKTKINKL